MTNDIREISVAEIVDPQNPMRSALDREQVWQLAESIKREGLINPITVRPAGDKFEVVAGHRRFVACKLANIAVIPCVVRELDDKQVVEVMAHENLERQEIDPVDEALFLGRLIGEDDSKIKEVAERLNRSEAWVEGRLLILTYPDNFLPHIKSGELKLGVALWLARIGDSYWRDKYLEVALTSGMSVPTAQYMQAQWEMGLLPKNGEMLPPGEMVSAGARQKARAVCARCGGTAEEPNLQLVYIHNDCPESQLEEKKELG